MTKEEREELGLPLRQADPDTFKHELADYEQPVGRVAWTPGPWRVVIDDDGNPLSGRPGVFASDELDCGIVHWDGFVQEYWRSARGDKEIHANARLIAAAPALYEALEAILPVYEEWTAECGHDPSVGVDCTMDFMRIAKARAALSLARGETDHD